MINKLIELDIDEPSLRRTGIALNQANQNSVEFSYRIYQGAREDNIGAITASIGSNTDSEGTTSIFSWFARLWDQITSIFTPSRLVVHPSWYYTALYGRGFILGQGAAWMLFPIKSRRMNH